MANPNVYRVPLPGPEPSERVLAMMDWLKEINGGALPARGQRDKAVDSLADDIANISIKELKGKIPDVVRARVAQFDDLTEDALKALVLDAAKLSLVADETPSGRHDQSWDTRRCWTNGTATCTCRMPPTLNPGSGLGGLEDDTFDVTCELDCPVGSSRDEILKAGACSCYPEDCVCTGGQEDRAWFVCGGCGRGACVCESVDAARHVCDVFCDCPWNAELTGVEDVVMEDVEMEDEWAF